MELAGTSADTARQAADLTITAKAAADDGVKAVARASEAMELVRSTSVEAQEAIRRLV